MSPRLESILSLLANKHHGLRSDEIREQLAITPKPLTRALAYLQSINAVCQVRVGQSVQWVAAAHRATAEAFAQRCKEESYRRELKHNARRKRGGRPGRPEPVREWPDADAWVPPGPRIPSVWDLPRVMGVSS